MSSPTEKHRYWLNFPREHIKRPVLWEFTREFEIVTNIRQATVTEDTGIVSLEMEGAREEIQRGITWLEELGVKVEPVEFGAIEG